MGGGDGLPAWVAADAGAETLEARDVVLWYTFAHTHLVRSEDWPVMPVANIGFRLVPANFFDHNPANDVAPSAPACEADCLQSRL